MKINKKRVAAACAAATLGVAGFAATTGNSAGADGHGHDRGFTTIEDCGYEFDHREHAVKRQMNHDIRGVELYDTFVKFRFTAHKNIKKPKFEISIAGEPVKIKASSIDENETQMYYVKGRSNLNGFNWINCSVRFKG